MMVSDTATITDIVHSEFLNRKDLRRFLSAPICMIHKVVKSHVPVVSPAPESERSNVHVTAWWQK